MVIFQRHNSTKWCETFSADFAAIQMLVSEHVGSSGFPGGRQGQRGVEVEPAAMEEHCETHARE